MAEHTSIRSSRRKQIGSPRKQRVFLSPEQVAEISKRVHAGENGEDLAQEFSVTNGLISRIRTTTMREIESLSGEEWRLIPGWEHRAKVSSLGRVVHYKNEAGGIVNRMLKPRSDPKGYLNVALYNKGKQKGFKVHRLVASAFLGACPSGLQVNHINGIKSDNRVLNLEYVTPSQNVQHAVRTGLRVAAKGQRHGMTKFTDAQVSEIKRLLRAGMRCFEVAKHVGTYRAQIHKIAHGLTWTHIE